MESSPLTQVIFKSPISFPQVCPFSNRLISFQAHAHVTKAAQLTSSAAPSPSVEILRLASAEHAQAATLFGKAASTTSDVEAGRTLHLMCSHHQKLADALLEAANIKANPKAAANSAGSATPLRTDSPEASNQRRGTPEDLISTQAFPPLTPPQTSQQHPYQPGAGLSTRIGKSTSSLLATNLASKRGILPAGQTLSPILSPTSTPGATSRRVPGEDFFTSNSVQPTSNPLLMLPPDRYTTKDAQGRSGNVSEIQAQASDLPFNKFYTSLETFVSKIGSPLAAPLGFAGMDLTLDNKDATTAAAAADGELVEGPTVSAQPDKDGYGYGYNVTDLVQNLVPKAWWSGQDERQAKGVSTKGRGLFGARGAWQHSGANESFYVVPEDRPQKTGLGANLPVSYAAVAGKLPSTLSEEPNPSPLRPKKTEHTPRRNRVAGPGDQAPETIPEEGDGSDVTVELDTSKTMEELVLENQQLRQLSDTLSRRLHKWEVNGRDSRAMLDRSLMLYRSNTNNKSSSDLNSSNGESEIQLKREVALWRSKVVEQQAEMEMMKSEIDTLKAEVEKQRREAEKATKKANSYKEQWDRLKMNARRRQELAATGGMTSREGSHGPESGVKILPGIGRGGGTMDASGIR